MHKSLVVFIHGLGGDASTWGEFPRLLREDPVVATRFDVVEPYTYSTSARGSGPFIDQLALELATFLTMPDRSTYTTIVLIGHSMGGLVARRYIADELIAGRRLRATKLLTYASPHLGSQWASSGSFVPIAGKQIDDLAVGSQFMNRLGLDWARIAADRNVVSRQVVAGDDAAVGQWSATGGYRYADFDVVRGKGHIPLVKPSSTDDDAFQIAKRFLLEDRPTRRAQADPDWRQPLLYLKQAAATHLNRFVFSARVTPFVGRETELEKLQAFLGTQGGVFSWMLIYGAGGVGKSRLALELSRALLESGEWYAGFVNERAEVPDWTRWQPIMPTALIIDYAANAPDRVENLLAGLAGRVGPDATHPLGQPVRVLLIEREGRGEWLESVVGQGATVIPVKEARHPDLPLESLSDPWPLIKHVIEAAGVALPDRETTLAQLAKIDRLSRPLFAYFLADALAVGRNVRSFDAERLIADVIDRERQNFWRPAGATPKDERALALATMTGGLPIAELEAVSGSLLPQWDRDGHPNIFGAMTGAPAVDSIPPLEPDIVGEHFVVETLGATNLTDSDRKHLCELAWRIGTVSMGRFVIRAHSDLPENKLLSLLRHLPSDSEAIKYWFGASIQLVTGLYARDQTAALTLIDEIRQRTGYIAPGFIHFFLQHRRNHTDGQKQLALAVYSALSDDPRPIADWVLETALQEFGSFLRTAIEHKQDALVHTLYAALAAEPQRLANRAFETSLHQVGAFLTTALEHGQDALVTSLCSALVARPNHFANRAFESSIDNVRIFFRPLRKKDLAGPLSILWRLIAADADRWGPKLADTTPLYIVSLLSSIPKNEPEIGVQLLSTQKLEHWEFGQYRNDRFSLGAAGLIVTFHRYGRADLKSALLQTLCQRGNPDDFGNPEYGLSELSRLLATADSSVPEEQITKLVVKVATPDWLRACFSKANIFSLSDALGAIAIHQPPQMIARLWSPALDHRLTAATDSLRRAREKELGANIRFLAAGALAGRLVKGVPLGQAELDRICRLPVDVLQHDPGAEGVDDWRQQLWMGLRFLASQSPGTMVVDLSAIQCTLVRWQVNHETTSIDPSTTAHWINKSMVRWLTACLANGTGKLLSDHEPLWLLTGFPQNPSEIR